MNERNFILYVDKAVKNTRFCTPKIVFYLQIQILKKIKSQQTQQLKTVPLLISHISQFLPR